MIVLRSGCSVVFPDYGIVFDFQPVDFQPVGLARTCVRRQWLVAGAAEEGRDYDAAELIGLWDVTNRQDWQIRVLVQQGVQSRRYSPGPISLDREPGVRAFVESYSDMLGEGTNSA